jgi:hypothetical protein
MQMALLFLTYLAPPGKRRNVRGSLWIMGPIVPLGFAPYYNLLWRFSTVYVADSRCCCCKESSPTCRRASIAGIVPRRCAPDVLPHPGLFFKPRGNIDRTILRI